MNVQRSMTLGSLGCTPHGTDAVSRSHRDYRGAERACSGRRINCPLAASATLIGQAVVLFHLTAAANRAAVSG